MRRACWEMTSSLSHKSWCNRRNRYQLLLTKNSEYSSSWNTKHDTVRMYQYIRIKTSYWQKFSHHFQYILRCVCACMRACVHVHIHNPKRVQFQKCEIKKLKITTSHLLWIITLTYATFCLPRSRNSTPTRNERYTYIRLCRWCLLLVLVWVRAASTADSTIHHRIVRATSSIFWCLFRSCLLRLAVRRCRRRCGLVCRFHTLVSVHVCKPQLPLHMYIFWMKSCPYVVDLFYK